MTVLNLQVSAGADDGAWSSTSSEFSNSGTNVTGHFAGNRYHSFFRFVDVLIPQGAELDEADILLQFSTGAGTDMSWRVQAQAQDDAVAPTNRSEALAMPLTSTYQDWTVFPAATPGTLQPVSSPDIVSVVQEVIDRPGWEPGNAILIAVRDIASASSNYRLIVSYDVSPVYVAVLSIEYTPPPNTPPTITVNPSVNYSGYTRLGPNNTPGNVSFTATDPEETDSNALSYEIRTASGSGGTLVASGNFTSGVAANVNIAHNASGINEGSNTLYLRVSDGTDYAPTNPSFTLLVDRTAPTLNGGITHNPDPVTGGS